MAWGGGGGGSPPYGVKVIVDSEPVAAGNLLTLRVNTWGFTPKAGAIGSSTPYSWDCMLDSSNVVEPWVSLGVSTAPTIIPVAPSVSGNYIIRCTVTDTNGGTWVGYGSVRVYSASGARTTLPTSELTTISQDGPAITEHPARSESISYTS